jgi:hypothetical protein
MRAPEIPLGTIIAERSFDLLDSEGKKRTIIVRLGRPVPDTVDDPDAFRCPFQIVGLEMDDKVFAPFGEDSFVALYYAIDFAGQILDREIDRLKLRNPLPPHLNHPETWIWRYHASPKAR